MVRVTLADNPVSSVWFRDAWPITLPRVDSIANTLGIVLTKSAPAITAFRVIVPVKHLSLVRLRLRRRIGLFVRGRLFI